MSKQAKIFIAIVALVLIILITYLLLKPKKAAVTETGDTGNTIYVGGSAATYKLDNFPFDVGSQGQNVKHMQIALNLIGGTNARIDEDGVFGPNTRIKLLTTVPATLSMLPMTKDRLNQIIKLGNDAA